MKGAGQRREKRTGFGQENIPKRRQGLDRREGERWQGKSGGQVRCVRRMSTAARARAYEGGSG